MKLTPQSISEVTTSRFTHFRSLCVKMSSLLYESNGRLRPVGQSKGHGSGGGI